MLSVAEDYLKERTRRHASTYSDRNPPESYAICESDMLMRNEQSARIIYGDSFTQDGFEGETFDYMLANPPTGRIGRPSRRRSKKRTPPRVRRPLRGRAAAYKDGQVHFCNR